MLRLVVVLLRILVRTVHLSTRLVIIWQDQQIKAYYGTIYAMRKETSAGFVVFRREGDRTLYLLLQNSSKKFWDFPKGNVDEGETVEAAAKRELSEEAGITEIKILEGFREDMNYKYTFRGDLIDKTVTMFLGEVTSPEVKLSWEHSAFEWVPIDDAKNILKDKKREVIEKANDFLSSSRV